MSSLSVNPIPLPLNDKLVLGKDRKRFPKPTDIDPSEYNINPLWADAFIQQSAQAAATPLRLNQVELQNQGASIGATDISGGGIAAGYYEVRSYARITTPATTGAATSSLTIAIGWTEGGVSQTRTFTALTGNTTATSLADPLLTILVDANSPITYAITYASNTAGQMRYRATFILSRVAS